MPRGRSAAYELQTPAARDTRRQRHACCSPDLRCATAQRGDALVSHHVVRATSPRCRRRYFAASPGHQTRVVACSGALQQRCAGVHAPTHVARRGAMPCSTLPSPRTRAPAPAPLLESRSTAATRGRNTLSANAPACTHMCQRRACATHTHSKPSDRESGSATCTYNCKREGIPQCVTIGDHHHGSCAPSIIARPAVGLGSHAASPARLIHWVDSASRG
jgi:hypothetical protein